MTTWVKLQNLQQWHSNQLKCDILGRVQHPKSGDLYKDFDGSFRRKFTHGKVVRRTGIRKSPILKHISSTSVLEQQFVGCSPTCTSPHRCWRRWIIRFFDHLHNIIRSEIYYLCYSEAQSFDQIFARGFMRWSSGYKKGKKCPVSLLVYHPFVNTRISNSITDNGQNPLPLFK